MSTKNTYVLATIKEWNLQAFARKRASLPGQWHVISNPDALDLKAIKQINPRYIFFPHWSWVVPKELIEAYECVCFHMTDLPYGRGGSPLQNLIVNGHTQTQITALRMSSDLDAGDIYLKHPLSLEGTAQEIFIRCAGEVFEMIEEMVKMEPTAHPQEGKATHFKRRTPKQSALTKGMDAQALFDHIRMLDADTYPHAYFDFSAFRMTFTKARLYEGALTAEVKFEPLKNEKKSDDHHDQ